MTSFTSQVPSKVLKSVALAWFEVLYSCLRYNEKRSLKEVDEESGYGSDGQQEKSLIARAEYRIACESAGDFEGKPKELLTTAITNKILERYMEYLLQKTGGGQGCFEFTYRVGFSNRPWCFLGGFWQSLTRIAGACEVLAHHWSKGKVDLKLMGCMRKNRSPVFEEMLFTVKIRLFVRETCMISAILSTHRMLLPTRNGQIGSKNNPRAITNKKSESATVQSLCKFSTGSKCSSDLDIFAVKSSKWQGIEWSESEGVNYPHGASFLPGVIKRSLQTSSWDDELAVEEKGNEKEFRGSYCFPAEASNAPLTPPSTSEDSSSLVSSPPLSPEERYNYWKVKDPMHNLRQILLTELQAKGIVTDEDGNKNGSPQSRFEAPIIEPTPPDSPEREDSRSSTPPPEHVRSFKDLYSKDAQPLLGSYGRLSSALKHFGTSVYQPLAKEQDHCPYAIPYAIDLLKPRYSSANELGTLPDSEHGLTGRPDEGKSKLFGTWTDITEVTPTSSSAFVDQFQYGFHANDNCRLMKMVEDLLDEDFSDGCQT